MMTNRESIKLSKQPIDTLIGNLYDYGCDARYTGQWEATLWEIERRLTLLYTPKRNVLRSDLNISLLKKVMVTSLRILSMITLLMDGVL